MKPHPRIRKTVKWGGAVVSVVLLVVWVGSGWCGVCLTSDRRFFANIVQGQARLHHTNGTYFDPPRVGWWSVDHFSLQLGFHCSDLRAWAWQAFIPLWPFVVVSCAITALGWRLDTLARRRARVGLCPKCNYNRAGLAPGAVCPECGSAAPAVRS